MSNVVIDADWLRVQDDREGFSNRYARARDLQAQGIADELLEIADDGRNDWMQRTGNGSTLRLE